MKHAIALAFLLVIGAGASAQAQPARDTSLRLDSTVSTRTARVGDPVELRTTSAMIIDGWSIPAGSAARGRVAHVRRPGRVRGRAELAIALVSVTRPDGSQLPVNAHSDVLQLARTGPVLPPQPTIPILAGMVAGYGAAALASHGSNSEDTVAGTGVVVGLATGVLVGVLKRGEDLVLLPGTTIDVIFESQNPEPENLRT